MAMSFLECLWALVSCALLSLTYVLSLYIWKTTDSRNHPSTVKKRFMSVLLMAFLSPCFVLFSRSFINEDFFDRETVSLWTMLGFRCEGLIPATVLPLILTAVLFSGPILIHYLDGVYRMYLKSYYWTTNVRNLLWLRNHIVAPFSEEFTFRACMLPILVPCFGVGLSVFICPLFFGIAHLHHLLERLQQSDVSLKKAVFQSLFQFVYTTIFGIYSTYLFLRTGHFVSCFACHAFCNHLGFPDFGEVLTLKPPLLRVGVAGVFVAGLVAWTLLLDPVTQPHIYNNRLFWK